MPAAGKGRLGRTPEPSPGIQVMLAPVAGPTPTAHLARPPQAPSVPSPSPPERACHLELHSALFGLAVRAPTAGWHRGARRTRSARACLGGRSPACRPAGRAGGGGPRAGGRGPGGHIPCPALNGFPASFSLINRRQRVLQGFPRPPSLTTRY